MSICVDNSRINENIIKYWLVATAWHPPFHANHRKHKHTYMLAKCQKDIYLIGFIVVALS